MDYLEACENYFNIKEVKKEVEKHCLDFAEFIDEVGEKDIYKGSDVLDWLGY